VLTIAVNLSRRLIIRERAHRRELRRETADPLPPSERLEGAELRTQVQDALSRLPFESRTAVTLSCVEGLSARDIARVLGCKEGTVWSRVFHAKKRLASLLSQVEAERAS
jgi:RNA polymerase sigma-70 factor (ECF subfamily)